MSQLKKTPANTKWTAFYLHDNSLSKKKKGLNEQKEKTWLEPLADSMKPQCNNFIANYQPAGDSHSTYNENSKLSVKNDE